jgi:hypothetical protein
MNEPNETERIWFNALGFSYREQGRIRACWVHDELGFSVPSDTLATQVVRYYRHAVERKAMKASQFALREALLPAMGITLRDVGDENDNATCVYTIEIE